MRPPKHLRILGVAIAAGMLAACGGGSGSSSTTTSAAATSTSAEGSTTTGAGATTTAGAGAAGAPSQAERERVAAALVKASDLGEGWTEKPGSADGDDTFSKCSANALLGASHPGEVLGPEFQRSSPRTEAIESSARIADESTARALVEDLRKSDVQACLQRVAQEDASKQDPDAKMTVTVSPVSIGDGGVRIHIEATYPGGGADQRIDAQAVMFRSGGVAVTVSHLVIGATVPASEVEALARKVAGRL